MIEIKMASPDRVYLETVIFPHYNNTLKPKIVLSVGVDWYTELYQKYFPDSLYLTIDFNSEKNIHCANGFHLNANVQHLTAENACDLIIFNGVYGYGISRMNEYNLTMKVLHRLLKPNGILIFGYNNLPDFNPLAITPDSDFTPLEKTRGPEDLYSFETSHNKHTYVYLQKLLNTA